ncbi:MAG TPA: molybdate ABC transporter substrate-binding protein, partial [Planctomycetaceae bacterium]|nr:molybdate ABC transporter substrate-binding protein [Planctomycetaceae bacterium]
MDRYRSEYSRQVLVEYGPSQTLLSRCEIGATGDLFLPADDSFLQIA